MVDFAICVDVNYPVIFTTRQFDLGVVKSKCVDILAWCRKQRFNFCNAYNL